MTAGFLIGVGLMTWGGTALLIDAWLARRRRPFLAERLASFSGSVADEAQVLLYRQT